MPKRAPAQYEPPGIDFNQAPFDEDALRRILAEARVPGSPDAAVLASACERLNHAAILLKVEQGVNEAPTEGASRATIERIRDAAAVLRKELPVLDDEAAGDDLFADAGVDPHVADGVTRLFTLTMSRLMQERVAQERDERGRGPAAEEIFGARNVADAFLVLTELLDLLVAASEIELEQRKGAASVKAASPLRRFVQSAGQVYLHLTGQTALPLSRSKQTGQLQGPLIPFLEGCCRQVGATEVKRETLADWVREARRRASRSASQT